MTSLLSQVTEGKAVQLTAVENEVSTQQVSRLLGISRPYLVKMLSKGILPYRKIGLCHRLRLADVMSYKAKLDAQCQRALQALTDDLQEMGLDCSASHSSDKSAEGSCHNRPFTFDCDSRKSRQIAPLRIKHKIPVTKCDSLKVNLYV